MKKKSKSFWVSPATVTDLKRIANQLGESVSATITIIVMFFKEHYGKERK